MRGVRVAVLAAVGVSGVATMLPQVHFASRRPLLHVALETVASFIALLAGSPVFGRLLRQGRLNELVLACALAMFALINLFLLTVPALVAPLSNDLTAWALLTGRFLAAALLASAFAPRRRLRRPGLALPVPAGCGNRIEDGLAPCRNTAPQAIAIHRGDSHVREPNELDIA
jgi:hypothetical protein